MQVANLGHPLNSGLLGWWMCPPGHNPSVYAFPDISGRNIHGVTTFQPPVDEQPPNWTTLRCDGVEERLQLQQYLLNGLSLFTLELVVNVLSTTGGVGLFQNGSSSGSFWERTRVFMRGSTNQDWNPSPTIPTGTTHIVLERTLAGMQMWFNGISQGTFSGTGGALTAASGTVSEVMRVSSGSGAGTSLTNGHLISFRVMAGAVGYANQRYQEYLRGYRELLTKPRKAMRKPAGAGAYTLTADHGSFTLSGQDASPGAARLLAADVGTFALSGQAADLLATRVITADAGSFTLSGQDATLTKGTPGAYTLTADHGVFSLSGQAVDLLAARLVVASHGVFSLAGQDSTILATRSLSADLGSFALSGQDATITWSGEAAVGQSLQWTIDSTTLEWTAATTRLEWTI